ncbi:MAG TPA: acetate kinase, partial [Chloroflexi bacterium]|nr:acetate kinase [Chloroflexota bacterium]
MLVLVVNAGSSSLKYQLVDTESAVVWASGLVERIGEAESQITHRTRIRGGEDAAMQEYVVSVDIPDHKAAFHAVTEAFARTGEVAEVGELVGVGHRVVQGADQFTEPTIVTQEVIDVIRDLIPLAPLHNPANLTGIEVAIELFPQATQVAVFDTAFHQTMPPEAYRYAIPYPLYVRHKIRRYGFHGTSHRYVAYRYRILTGKSYDDTNIIT